MCRRDGKLLIVAVLAASVLGRQMGIVAQDDPPSAEQPGGDVPPSEQAEPESPLLVEPKQPEQVFDAVVLMVNLARPKLARRYLEQLIESKPNTALLLKLRDKHGPAIFLKLANTKELQPLSVQLLDRVNEAFRRQGADPKRIDALIADLSKTVQQREVALIALKSAGPVVVPRILSHLGDPANAGRRDLLLNTLIRLGKQVVPPLIGALDTPNEALRGVVIEALGWIGSPRAVPYLWYPAFAPNQPAGTRTAARGALVRIHESTTGKVERFSSYGVAAELKRVALEHFANQYQWELDEDDGKVALWSWLDDQGTVGVTKVSPKAASLYVGTRLARQALRIAPDRHDLQALFVGLTLASARHRAGPDQPLPTGPGTAYDLALTAGADVVTTALSQAIGNGSAATARATLQALGQIATKRQLYGTGGKRSPIVAALNYPDSRVQFAAASTILQLDADKPFRGAGRVVEILTRALTDSGGSRAVVVDANEQRAATLSGLIGEMSYDAQIASTGRDGFRIASERMDVELIFLEINTIRWGLSQTIANLRADARTAAIPIVIYGSDSMRPRVASLLSRYPLITYMITSATIENVQSQLRPFLNRIQSPPPTPQQRVERKRAAAFWFAHIANGRRTRLYDIAPAEEALFEAVNDPDLAQNAMQGLSAIPTKSAQRRFQEVALSGNRDVGVRETATLQLAFHIQRFGLLLTEKQVAEIKATWQKTTNPALATALASVVGSLGPDAKRAQQRLQNFSLPTKPVP